MNECDKEFDDFIREKVNAYESSIVSENDDKIFEKLLDKMNDGGKLINPLE